MKQFTYISILTFSVFNIILHQNLVAQTRQRISLSGIITDARTGEVLPGASVLIQDARIGTTADTNGKYTFTNIPPGHHLIEISHTGYTTLVEHIDVTTTAEKSFTLQPTIVENQGVTVTGVSSAVSIRKAPVPVTLIKKSELLRTPATNLIDVLTRQPGVSQISTGPAISKPVIRGLSYNRVVVINEGVRQEGQQWGDEHGVEIDELSVNRIEILKGPASLIYGSDALGGVVNFITNIPVEEGVIKGNVYSNYHTNNRMYGLYTNIAGNSNGFNWNLYGSHKSAKDYINKYDGRVLNSRFNEKNFGGYVGLNKGWGFTHLIFSSFNQNLGLVEGTRDSATGRFILYGESPLEHVATNDELNSREVFVPYQHVQHYKLISDNSFSFGESKLKLNIGLQNNIRKELGDPEDKTAAELEFDLKTTTYNIQYIFPERKHWQTTIGLSGMYQKNLNKGEEVIIPQYNLFDFGTFIFAQKFFDKVTLSGGLRYDRRSLHSDELIEGSEEKFTAFDRKFINVSGSAGLSYQPTGNITLKANVAQGFRAPTLSELASNGAHEGTNRYEYGQQNLKSEKSLQFDAGIEADYTHFTFSLNGFYNRIRDFIFYRRLNSVFGGDSILIDQGEELEAFRYNQNDAKLSGFEVVFDLHPHPLDWLHFENTFSFVRGKFLQAVANSNNLPMIPAPEWRSELRANFTKAGKSLRNLYVSFEADKTFNQNKPFTGYNTETATAGYTLLNAGFGTEINNKNRTVLSIHLAANNITDKAYQNHLNRLKYADVNNVTGRRGVYNTGRNFSIKLNVPFSFNLNSVKEVM